MFRLRSGPVGSVIGIYGEIDLTTSDAFDSVLCTAHASPGLVVVTFEKCTYLDSSALAVLYRNERRLARRLWLAVPAKAPARRIFVAAGVHAYFQMVETVGQAFEEADVA